MPVLARLCLVLVLAFVPRIALADKQQAVPLVQQADKDYKLGRFAEALDGYTRAYELFPAPALLFNIGQCHRNLGQHERAVFFFRGFLRDNPSSPNRAVVEELIKESEAALERERIAAEQKAAEERRLAEEAARRQAEERARREAEERERREAAEAERARLAEQRRVEEARLRAAEEQRRIDENRIYKKWWFWTAVGGALAVGGTAYYFSGDTTVVQPAGSLGGLDRR